MAGPDTPIARTGGQDDVSYNKLPQTHSSAGDEHVEAGREAHTFPRRRPDVVSLSILRHIQDQYMPIQGEYDSTGLKWTIQAHHSCNYHLGYP